MQLETLQIEYSAAEQLLSGTSNNKKIIILFSAGEISPFSLITRFEC